MNHLRIAATMAAAMLLTAAAFGAAVPADTDNGAKEIMIDAGSKGSVFFPHRRHQEMENTDCQTCHNLFPQKPDSIGLLEKEGTLKPRQVMNSLCISCHRETAEAGKPSGPRSCNICHPK